MTPLDVLEGSVRVLASIALGETRLLDNAEYRAAFLKNIMVPRFGEPADIAAGVVYLASDESKYVTGTELTIDGGALCHQALPEMDVTARSSS